MLQCDAFNSVLSLAKSDSMFKDMADWRESDFIDMRPQHKRARTAYTLTSSDKAGRLGARKTHVARCAWGWMMAFVECKETEGDSAFYFLHKSKFLRNTEAGYNAQAQIAKYAAEIQIRQHRTHVWSFYFAGPWVRIQRWDRAGCIVSQALDLREDATDFINFLYRFARLDHEGLGYDNSAVLATPKEINMLKNYKSENGALEWFRDHMLTSEMTFPIYKASLFHAICSLHLISANVALLGGYPDVRRRCTS